MKKTWLLPLLLVGVMAGCANEDSGDTKVEDPNADLKADLGSDPTVQGATLSGKFNVTHISGIWDDSASDKGIWLGGKDLKNEFHNEKSSWSFKSVPTSEKYVNKSQLDQGPKIGGIKFTGGGIDFNMPDGTTCDAVVYRFRSWTGKEAGEDFQIKIGEDTIEKTGDNTEFIDIEYKATDMKTFGFTVPFLGSDVKNRPTLCGVYTFEL